MNAYIASFMLLLFNAVGLAVPASATTEERMMPELGSAADLSETALLSQCAGADAVGIGSGSHQFCDDADAGILNILAIRTAIDSQMAWAVFTMRSEAGDKLEHVEGAP